MAMFDNTRLKLYIFFVCECLVACLFDSALICLVRVFVLLVACGFLLFMCGSGSECLFVSSLVQLFGGLLACVFACAVCVFSWLLIWASVCMCLVCLVCVFI